MRKFLRTKSIILLALACVTNAHAGLAGYGVIIGQPTGHSLFNGGQWPHYHITVQPSGGPVYDTALDLYSPSQAIATEVAHREIVLHPRNAYLYNGIFALPDGYHPLPYNQQAAATGGALDFARHPGILRDLEDQSAAWEQSPLINAAKTDVPSYSQLLTNAVKVYIFGAPYTSGNGVHDVHANQGDASNSSFVGDDGIWQDGAVIIEYANNDLDVVDCGSQFCRIISAPHRVMLMARFQAQSEYTNESGISEAAGPLQHIKGSALSGSGLISYGPFNAHQVELHLNAAGGDNPEVFIKSDSKPTLTDYGVKAISFARGYSATGQLYISVKPSSSNITSLQSFYWDYLATFAP